MPLMHVGKPYKKQSLTSHLPGRRTLKILRRVRVNGMVIIKTLGTRWLNLRFFWVLAHGSYRVIAVNKYTEVTVKEAHNNLDLLYF